MSEQKLPTDFHKAVPEGDERERDICKRCDFIHYDNPKIVTGAVVEHEGKILLCKRSIEPRIGFWTLPAGFMELGETPMQGAARETYEEARAELIIGPLLGVYTVRRLSQVQMFYKAKMAKPGISAGPESEEVAFFDWDDIPWDELAFPSVHWALTDYEKVRGRTDFTPFGNPDKYKDV